MIDARTTRTALLLMVLAVFLMVPLRIIAYGFMPPDDALRHAAFAVTDRTWGDILVLDPRFPTWMDPHAGWHAVLRAVHAVTQWDPSTLVDLSVLLALWTFTLGGLIVSGQPLAWFLACAIMAMLEPALFGKLALGRPLFFSMTGVMVLLFLWSRRTPLRLPVEIGAVAAVLSIGIYLHPSSWYLWGIAVLPLAACQRWRSLGAFIAGWGIALGITCLLNGWYNAIVLPVDILRLAVLQGGTLGTNLAMELQPSGAPVQGLVGVGLMLVARKASGHDLREELRAVDLAMIVTAWILGLYVSRFWVEWGLPAMVVWFTRQIGDELGFGFAGLQRRAVPPVLAGAAAAAFYLAETADVNGRYTNALRNPLFIAPVEEIAADLPEPGGVLYSTDMLAFFAIFHRVPDGQFRFATGMEPGLMPAEDLKVLRAIQTTGVTSDYKPWFDKMRPADRVLIRSAAAPEWPGMTFKRFYGGWMGRKAQR